MISPPTTLWGYNGSWPGPTIEAQTGQPVRINWVSKLPRTHLLPVDHSIHGAEMTLPAVRNVAHLHGACVLGPMMTTDIRRRGSTAMRRSMDRSLARIHCVIRTASLRPLFGITIIVSVLPGLMFMLG